jgi:lipid-A-disaccharide synthase
MELAPARNPADPQASNAIAGLLFTAFEPSGDDHASAVIAELRRRYPTLPIYAWGGAKMAAAGATIVEHTGDDAVMGVPGAAKVIDHYKMNRRIAQWMDEKIARLGPGGASRLIHIPVDSPGANFPICAVSKKRGIKVVHLVAPQIWAWASWRIRKLRRLTDMVLCLLPFEEDWFLARGVPAKFIGHPLFDHPLETESLDQRAAALGDGSPKLALMPGSRPSEISGCLPILLDAFRRLRVDFPNTTGVVAATKPPVADWILQLADQHGGWPEGLKMAVADTDAVIRWCDFAVVVSGTVTLQIAKQCKPMVALYRPNWLMYQLLGRWLVSTRYFTLPNLIAGKRILKEFIPHFGDGDDLAVEVIRFLRQPGYADDQRHELQRVTRRFEGKVAAGEAADAIEAIAGLKSPPRPLEAAPSIEVAPPIAQNTPIVRNA